VKKFEENTKKKKHTQKSESQKEKDYKIRKIINLKILIQHMKKQCNKTNANAL